METFADKVRATLETLSAQSDTVTAMAIAETLGIKNKKEKQPLYCTISDMKARGELVSTDAKGVYRYVPVKKNYLRTVMWRLLRSRQKVTVEDLQELAGVSENYAYEWLRMLEKREVVIRMKGGTYRLTEDPVDEPLNTERIMRLRDWRKRQKQALSALDQASAAIDQAREALGKE